MDYFEKMIRLKTRISKFLFCGLFTFFLPMITI